MIDPTVRKVALAAPAGRPVGGASRHRLRHRYTPASVYMRAMLVYVRVLLLFWYTCVRIYMYYMHVCTHRRTTRV
jgi:hypothetical protein